MTHPTPPSLSPPHQSILRLRASQPSLTGLTRAASSPVSYVHNGHQQSLFYPTTRVSFLQRKSHHIILLLQPSTASYCSKDKLRSLSISPLWSFLHSLPPAPRPQVLHPPCAPHQITDWGDQIIDWVGGGSCPMHVGCSATPLALDASSTPRQTTPVTTKTSPDINKRSRGAGWG